MTTFRKWLTALTWAVPISAVIIGAAWASFNYECAHTYCGGPAGFP